MLAMLNCEKKKGRSIYKFKTSKIPWRCVKHHYFLFWFRGSQVQSLRSHFLSHCIQTLDNTRSEQARSSCVTQQLRFQVKKMESHMAKWFGRLRIALSTDTQKKYLFVRPGF